MSATLEYLGAKRRNLRTFEVTGARSLLGSQVFTPGTALTGDALFLAVAPLCLLLTPDVPVSLR